ncbi:MAG: glutaredoxin family protein [Deltaproteobacteria bacterium]
MIEVVVYSKPGCHLCDEVKAQLARLRASFNFEEREINILDDPRSFEVFKDDIPVVFINGKKAFKYRLDEKEFARRMEAILAGERKLTHGA